MKTFDVIALGELNVDLILNRIAGFPEVGKEIFARDMICTLAARRPFSPPTSRRWAPARRSRA